MALDSRCGVFIAMPGGYRLDTLLENHHSTDRIG
jgi:hypothetical protein